MNKEELYSVNIHAINEKELRDFVAKLQKMRIDMNDVPSVSAMELTSMLNIAASELGSRSSARLAKVSIGIAVFSLAVAALSITLGSCS